MHIHKVNKKTNKNDKKIWTTFAFHSPKIRRITNLFKNTNIGIAFKTTIILHHLIKPIAPTLLQEHEKRGIYKITCKTCHKAYIGQTSRKLKSNSGNTYGTLKTMTLARHMHYIYLTADMNIVTLTTLTLLKEINTPTILLPYEQMYIQSFHHNNELIPEQHPNEHNPIFDFLHSNTTRHNPPDA